MKPPFLIFFSLLLLLSPLNTFAQLQAITGKTSYPFWIHSPKHLLSENVDKEKLPIFVFLHGRSLCGTNLERVKRYGMLQAIARGHSIPGYVVAPQSRTAWNPSWVMEVIDHVLANYPNSDSTRVYICGMSLGGYGTMSVVGTFPERIAAAVAICGGGNRADAPKLATVPIRLYHGTADKIVPISESRKIVKAVQKVDPHANIELIEVRKGTHSSVERLFHKDEIYDWLLQHHSAP